MFEKHVANRKSFFNFIFMVTCCPLIIIIITYYNIVYTRNRPFRCGLTTNETSDFYLFLTLHVNGNRSGCT